MINKALIVANFGPEFYVNGESVPGCFLPISKDMCVIEKQISLLNINGFKNEDIRILCGDSGVWNSKYIKSKLEKLMPTKVFVSKNNVIKGNIFSDSFFHGDRLFILQGNCNIDIAIISRLKRYSPPNVIVTEDSITPTDSINAVHIEMNCATSLNNQTGDYSWTVFAGIVKISLDLKDVLRQLSRYDRPLIDILGDLVKQAQFNTISYNDLVFGRLNGGYSEELTGGSYSKLNYRLIVKKESDEDGRDKLINEIKWLLSLPPELKPYFSEVLEYDITSSKVFYNVPYYGSRNLRENIFDGHLDVDGACDFICNLLNWMFNNVYSRKIQSAPPTWIKEKHILRVLNRLPECIAKSSELGNIIEAKHIIINGKKYRNVKELYTVLLNNKELQEKLNPTYLVMIHGDLHFQNILLTNETDTGFILVDPRGECSGSDIYYDLGKLWHSFHAKYDFIHSDQFKYEISWNNSEPIANYDIINKLVVETYEQIHKKMNLLIKKFEYIKNDPCYEMKILFAEASHLCSVSTFHIHKTATPDRAVVMYLIGVQLINEFFEKYLPDQ